MIVEQGLLHALAHSLRCGEVDNSLDVGILLEHFLGGILVAQVYLLKSRTHAGNLLDTIQHLLVRVREIVYHHYVVASLLQLYRGMRPDKTGTARNQNCLFHNCN